jgi:arylsulfatase A-like enzyme
VPPGWDTWYGRTRNTYYGYDLNQNGRIVSYGFAPKDYSTDVYADLAVSFIQDKAGTVEEGIVDEVQKKGGRKGKQQKKKLRKQQKRLKKQQQKKKQQTMLSKTGIIRTVNAQETEVRVPYFLMVAVDAPHTDGGRSAPRTKAQSEDTDAPAKRLKNQRDQTQREDDEDTATTDGQDGLTTHVVKDYYAMPAERDRKNCEPVSVGDFPGFAEADVADKSEWIRTIPAWNTQDRERMGRFATSQVCSLKAVDRLVKRVVEAAGNDLDNTVIIFASDNGYSWGEHRWSAKNCAYDACTRIPLVISHPKLTKQPSRVNTFAELVDIPVTIAALAHADVPQRVNGKNLLSVLTEPDTTIREDVSIELHNNKTKPKGQDYALRTDDYLYIELGTGERELYDLRNDPGQLRNLMSLQFAETTYKTVLADLSKRLAEKKKE